MRGWEEVPATDLAVGDEIAFARLMRPQDAELFIFGQGMGLPIAYMVSGEVVEAVERQNYPEARVRLAIWHMSCTYPGGAVAEMKFGTDETSPKRFFDFAVTDEIARVLKAGVL